MYAGNIHIWCTSSSVLFSSFRQHNSIANYLLDIKLCLSSLAQLFDYFSGAFSPSYVNACCNFVNGQIFSQRAWSNAHSQSQPYILIRVSHAQYTIHMSSNRTIKVLLYVTEALMNALTRHLCIYPILDVIKVFDNIGN